MVGKGYRTNRHKYMGLISNYPVFCTVFLTTPNPLVEASASSSASSSIRLTIQKNPLKFFNFISLRDRSGHVTCGYPYLETPVPASYLAMSKYTLINHKNTHPVYHFILQILIQTKLPAPEKRGKKRNAR